MRVLSGIQPTGIVHLGNYFGALKNWVEMQNAGNECYFFFANQHAITMPQNPEDLRKNVISLAATLMAVGIDPSKSVIFVQSDVPAHSQFAWVLNCLVPMGQMERMIQFKEKSEQNTDAVNLGLFTYPVLQAADILLYKPEIVPVGVDQAQHLELTRLLAERFNRTYKEIFPIPKTLHTETTKVVGLDGGAKMSKSRNNYIGLVEDQEAIWKKLSVAATDPARIKRSDPGNPFVCNIYSLHKLFSSSQDLGWVEDGCKTAKIGCLDCKKRLFQNMEGFLIPIKEKYDSLMKKEDFIRDILADGAKRASRVANETLNEIYDLVGFKY